jgi:acylphosphatase
MTQLKRFQATVHGRVQGVSFRHYTQLEARRLGVTGWVANQRDGTVHVVAEGSEKALQQFEYFLRQGSPAAQVAQLEIFWEPVTGEFTHFSIKWLV